MHSQPTSPGPTYSDGGTPGKGGFGLLNSLKKALPHSPRPHSPASSLGGSEAGTPPSRYETDPLGNAQARERCRDQAADDSGTTAAASQAHQWWDGSWHDSERAGRWCRVASFHRICIARWNHTDSAKSAASTVVWHAALWQPSSCCGHQQGCPVAHHVSVACPACRLSGCCHPPLQVQTWLPQLQ